ncbi:MAG: type 4a pilus biogenesis protein PilO [Planctomycetota bacterium]
MRFGIREAVFILVLIGVLATTWLFIFQPRNEQTEEARADILRKQQKLQDLEAATAAYMDLDAEIKKLATAIADFEQKLPADHREATVVGDVTDIARRHRLDVRRVKPDKLVRNPRYSEKPIRMTIVGDFDRFYSFLLDLDKMPRITQTPQMTLERLDGEQDGMMEAELTLSIFFEGEAANTTN